MVWYQSTLSLPPLHYSALNNRIIYCSELNSVIVTDLRLTVFGHRWRMSLISPVKLLSGIPKFHICDFEMYVKYHFLLYECVFITQIIGIYVQFTKNVALCVTFLPLSLSNFCISDTSPMYCYSLLNTYNRCMSGTVRYVFVQY